MFQLFIYLFIYSFLCLFIFVFIFLFVDLWILQIFLGLLFYAAFDGYQYMH